jgi:hypothetical protein
MRSVCDKLLACSKGCASERNEPKVASPGQFYGHLPPHSQSVIICFYDGLNLCRCGTVGADGPTVLTNDVAPEPKGSSPHSQQPATGPYPEAIGSTTTPQANLL